MGHSWGVMQKKELSRCFLNCWCAVMEVFYSYQGMGCNELVKFSLEDGDELMHPETHESETRPSPQRVLASCIKNRFAIREMSRMGARRDSRTRRMVAIVSGGRLSFAPCTLSLGSPNVIRWAPWRVSLPSLSWTFHQAYPLDLRFRLPPLANSWWAMATLGNFGMPSGGRARPTKLSPDGDA